MIVVDVAANSPNLDGQSKYRVTEHARGFSIEGPDRPQVQVWCRPTYFEVGPSHLQRFGPPLGTNVQNRPVRRQPWAMNSLIAQPGRRVTQPRLLTGRRVNSAPEARLEASAASLTRSPKLGARN